MTDELMEVVEVVEVVEGIEEDVRIVEEVVEEASTALGKAFGATEVRTRLRLGSNGDSGRGRDSDSDRGIDYSSRLVGPRVSRRVKTKETTKFVWGVLSVGLITTSVSKWAMWHGFSKEGLKKGMWGEGG